MKFSTQVSIEELPVRLEKEDKVMVLGSCFADNIGSRLPDAGFDARINPFGTLYNPASILKAVERLDSGHPFVEEDCVEMGAGAGLVCSFSHHTSFARPDKDSFLKNANEAFKDASAFWKECRKVIITLGTAYVWKHDGEVVSNCLKRPSREFEREMLGIDECRDLLESIIAGHPDKQFIITVSPIRHMSDGAHSNTLSKATLQLACSQAICGKPNACYFPAFEIMMDELRDYRFYADDLVHPSGMAVQYIWERFVEAAVPEQDRQSLHDAEKTARALRHRPLH